MNLHQFSDFQRRGVWVNGTLVEDIVIHLHGLPPALLYVMAWKEWFKPWESFVLNRFTRVQ